MVFSEGYLLLMVLICLVLTTYLSLLLYKENARDAENCDRGKNVMMDHKGNETKAKYCCRNDN